MAVADAASYAIHVLFAAAWTGSVLFMTYAVLPTARTGDIGVDPLANITSRLSVLSRTSALLLLLTGGHLAATRYGGGALTGTTKGYLVIAMLVLWFMLIGLVEVGTSRIGDGIDERKVRTPAENARPLFLAASVVALLLLVDAGIILGL
jgi:uncharacterized membrane protein